ncbi:MAG TPA: hypothetical protein VIO60_10730 [Rectinemataceae bacterium]
MDDTAENGSAPLPSCPANPFGEAELSYPIGFDLRVIYLLEGAGDFQQSLEKALADAGVPWTMIQGTKKPEARYGRMGARVTVSSKAAMDKLYAAVAAIPGVKAVI